MDRSESQLGSVQTGVFRSGVVRLDGPTDWPDGTAVTVLLKNTIEEDMVDRQPVVIAGFGLGGRFCGDLLEHFGVPFTIIETNADTVATQRALGRRVVHGDTSKAEVLQEAGVADACAIALTVPDEHAVLEAITQARRLNPELHIIARTNFASNGRRASKLGATEVIIAEQAVGIQFHDRLRRHLLRLNLCARK